MLLQAGQVLLLHLHNNRLVVCRSASPLKWLNTLNEAQKASKAAGATLEHGIDQSTAGRARPCTRQSGRAGILPCRAASAGSRVPHQKLPQHSSPLMLIPSAVEYTLALKYAWQLLSTFLIQGLAVAGVKVHLFGAHGAAAAGMLYQLTQLVHICASARLFVMRPASQEGKYVQALECRTLGDHLYTLQSLAPSHMKACMAVIAWVVETANNSTH